MPRIIEVILAVVSSFFTLYIILYTTYLLMSVLVGAMQLYTRERMAQVRNELKHDYYMPISILVPAHNEEVTIVDGVKSLLELDYKRMMVQNPGSFMLMLRHLRVNDTTAISSRYEAYCQGRAYGTEIGGCYAPIKNVELGAKYFFGKDEVTKKTKTFVRTEAKYFF